MEPDGRIYFREYSGEGRGYELRYRYPRKRTGGRAIYSGLDRATCQSILTRLDAAGWSVEKNGGQS